jgi:hypothetical protein
MDAAEAIQRPVRKRYGLNYGTDAVPFDHGHKVNGSHGNPLRSEDEHESLVLRVGRKRVVLVVLIQRNEMA